LHGARRSIPNYVLTYVFPDRALKQAQGAEARYFKGDARPLEGVPVAIKDFHPVKGEITTFGSLIHKDFRPDNTAPTIERLFGAGAIMHCRTTTPEFAHSGVTKSLLWGVSRNPWNTEYSPPRDYIDATRRGRDVYKSLAPILERYDVMICPTTAVPSVKADHRNDDPDFTINGKRVPAYVQWILTYPFNLMSQCPVASIPSGFSSRGIPTGLQVVGRTFDDLRVFQAAAAFEVARPWRQRRPNL